MGKRERISFDNNCSTCDVFKHYIEAQKTTFVGVLRKQRLKLLCVAASGKEYEGRHIYDGLGYLRLGLRDGVTKVVSGGLVTLGGAPWFDAVSFGAAV